MGNSNKTNQQIADAFERTERHSLFCHSKMLSTALQKAMLIRKKQGDITSPSRGIYARTERWEQLTPRERYLWTARTLQAMHPDWVFCGYTAAVAWGIADNQHAMERFVIAGCTGKSEHLPNVIHHVTDTSKIQKKEGLNVTPLGRTMFDCLRWMSFPIALAIADETIKKKHFNQARAEEIVLKQTKSQGRQRAFDILQYADDRSENGGESIVRALIILSGFEPPQAQMEFVDPLDAKHVMRADFGWVVDCNGTKRTIVLELDGLRKYTNSEFMNGMDSEEVRSAERLRESHLTMVVDSVLRISFGDALNQRKLMGLLQAAGIPRVAKPIAYSVPICADW